MDVPTLELDGFVLRAWRDEDRDPFATMNADPVVMEHFVAPMPRDASDAFVDRILARWQENGYGLWAVDVDGSFAGYVGLNPSDFDAAFTPTVEVGWRLARPYWGRGIATHGGRAALTHGFDVVGLAEVDSWTAVGNERSWRVMERLGMVRDGGFEHPRVPVGHPVRPHVLYRMTVERWRTLAAGT
jgi:RimJ/RimL family protein N-acetyltransferase